jgi:hypothetical protein
MTTASSILRFVECVVFDRYVPLCCCAWREWTLSVLGGAVLPRSLLKRCLRAGGLVFRFFFAGCASKSESCICSLEAASESDTEDSR